MVGTTRIVISRYDERWPTEFGLARSMLADALGEVAVRIDHIGSTSVPGLAAKDVIDIQITVADLDDARLRPALEGLGATATDITRDHELPDSGDVPTRSDDWEKRCYRPPAGWRPAHLHVRANGRANQRYALLFRDYLRSAPDAAEAYARIKVALARLHPDDAVAYDDVKDPVCDLVMQAAERWASATRWRS